MFKRREGRRERERVKKEREWERDGEGNTKAVTVYVYASLMEDVCDCNLLLSLLKLN